MIDETAEIPLQLVGRRFPCVYRSLIEEREQSARSPDPGARHPSPNRLEIIDNHPTGDETTVQQLLHSLRVEPTGKGDDRLGFIRHREAPDSNRP